MNNIVYNLSASRSAPLTLGTLRGGDGVHFCTITTRWYCWALEDVELAFGHFGLVAGEGVRGKE